MSDAAPVYTTMEDLEGPFRRSVHFLALVGPDSRIYRESCGWSLMTFLGYDVDKLAGWVQQEIDATSWHNVSYESCKRHGRVFVVTVKKPQPSTITILCADNNISFVSERIEEPSAEAKK